jgi:hypothetical protein
MTMSADTDNRNIWYRWLSGLIKDRSVYAVLYGAWILN